MALLTNHSPAAISPLLKPQSERVIYDIDSAEQSNNFCVTSRTRIFQCSYCHFKILSRAGLVNHEKYHKRKWTRKKRADASRKAKRIFSCKECDEEFAKREELTSHMKSHSKLIKCLNCNEEFKDRMAYDLHDAIQDGLNYDQLNFPAHRTRSQSRLSCHSVAPPLRPYSCDGTYYNGSRTPVDYGTSRKRRNSTGRMSRTKKPRSVEDWIENNCYVSDDHYSDGASVRSFLQSRSTLRSITPAMSMRSSVYSVANTFYNKYHCSETNCRKVFPTLNWVTAHELAEHKKLALIQCIECRCCFTTSENLNQHKIDSHPNVLICVLCDYPQRGVEAIQEHFNLHQKYSVKCDVCSKQFLSKYYLDEHLKHKSERHNNYRSSKARILFREDRRDTLLKDIDFDELDINVDNTYPFLPKYTHVFYYEIPLDRETFDRSIYRNSVDDLPWRFYWHNET